MRLPRMAMRRWMIAVGCILIAVGLLFGLCTGYARPGNPLAGVAEPITITGCFFFDDGGSRTLEFKDAKQRKHYACWVADEYGGNLIPGRFAPLHDHKELSRYPVGGPGDRALLGSLERRSHRDSNAQLLERRIQQAAQGRMDAGSLWKE